jgi:CheY-like chemotaxis protein
MARILIIDDDKAVREMLLATLTAAGHTAVAATNGLEGLKVFRSTATDLIITDIMMPYGGLATIRMLRAESPKIGIIAMSGGGPFRLDYARGFGVHTTLAKPFTAEQLMAAIAQEMPIHPDPEPPASGGPAV